MFFVTKVHPALLCIRARGMRGRTALKKIDDTYGYAAFSVIDAGEDASKSHDTAEEYMAMVREEVELAGNLVSGNREIKRVITSMPEVDSGNAHQCKDWKTMPDTTNAKRFEKFMQY